jgi:peptide/nickel transport system permease protein
MVHYIIRRLLWAVVTLIILSFVTFVIFWVSIGMTVGAISAVCPRSLLDRVTVIGSLLAISAPTFWLGLMALFLFSSDIGVIHIFDRAGTYIGLTANPGR